MSVSEHMRVSDGRRFEVFTGAGRRCRLAEVEAAAIVEESYAGGTSVCGVARRHGLTPRLLFARRRLARLGPSRSVERPLFVPVVVTTEPDPSTKAERSASPKPRKRRRRSEEATIELEIGGVLVRVGTAKSGPTVA